MQFKASRSERDLTITCEGRFTFDDHRDFKTIIDDLQDNPPAQLVFNVANVEFMDSAAMGMLLIANDACKKSQTIITLRGATGQVGRMVRIAKFSEIMSLE